MRLPQHGIIYCGAGSQKYSAIIFPNGLVLTTGLILLQIPISKEVEVKLFDRNFICINDTPELHSLQAIDFTIIKEDAHGQLIEKTARIAFTLCSKAVEQVIKFSFGGLQFLHGDKYRYMTECCHYFSTCLLFQYSEDNLSTANIKNFFEYLFNNIQSDLKIMDEIVCVNTPFGNEHFLNSITYGHVANIFGRNNCLTLLNVPTAFGCEGGGVYDKQLNLRSMMLGSCFMRQGDNICFPLAINLTEIFKVSITKVSCNVQADHFFSKMIASVCLVDTMNLWGTGCVFKMNNRNFVLTCSHVLGSENFIGYAKDCELQLELLFKNQIFDSAYDVALFEVRNKFDIERPVCQLADYIPIIGQQVYSVGFPLFKTFGLRETFKPTIFKGRVAKYLKGLVVTDCPVQVGQSGGPIFDLHDNLLAVMVSNFKSCYDGKVYPHHNMCIPMCDIYDIVKEYCETNDAAILKKLQANRVVVDKWKLRSPEIGNKL
ncbi:uncharacterized protein LOC131690278 [Topomyia yanbarensis]|uniref:uncharacterized protein LOC131690278 n=1 Tax=Topomyia yanbarensis TaxID=2498891 RepID=UPI00273C9219|nr:uncharacterized protein LOC131690278 [Topomyia yanbarensis]